MAYVGQPLGSRTLSTASQRLSGDGVSLSFTLDQAVGKASDLILHVGGTYQVPEADYTASGVNLIFSSGNAPASATNNISVVFVAGSLTTIFLNSNAFPTGNTVSPSIYSTTASATGIHWPSTTSLGFSVSGNARVVVSDASQGAASSTTSGALRVTGGIGATGAVFANTVSVVAGTESTSSTTGALKVSGGIGATGSMFLGGSMTVSGGLTVAGSFNTTSSSSLTVNTPFVFLANTNVGDAIDQGFVGTFNDGVQRYAGLVRTQSDGRFKLFTNLDNQPTTLVDTANVSFRYADLWYGNANVTSTTNSTSSLTGAMTVMGGLGVRGTMYINSQNNALAIGNGGTSGVGNIGASGATFNTIFAKATTAQYADLAEKYLADDEYASGTVLHFGGSAEVSVCDVDMCAKIAGVVSTQPGYVMNEGLAGDHVVTVALLGRVPCKVQGPIRKGDMLVSAGNGHARAEQLPQIGTVIGKALENFDGAEGVIEVVVGRN